MDSILQLRKTIRDFFGRYDLFLVPCLKFLLAFFSFILINRTLPYMDVLGSPVILIILSLLCAILPVVAIAVIGTVMIILQCFAANLMIGIVALLLFILLLVLLLRFVPSDCIWVILTPFAFALNLAAVIPIALGLLRNRASVIAGIGGVIVYCFISDVGTVASLAASGRLEQLEVVQRLVGDLVGHRELILSSIVFTAVILIVNLIRRMLTRYTYLTAVAAGGAVFFVLRLIGAFFLEKKIEAGRDLLGVLLSVAVCLVIAFFIHCADYKRTRLLQFEDDDYYYYVKAVPKRTPDTDTDLYDTEDEEEPEEEEFRAEESIDEPEEEFFTGDVFDGNEEEDFPDDGGTASLSGGDPFIPGPGRNSTVRYADPESDFTDPDEDEFTDFSDL